MRIKIDTKKYYKKNTEKLNRDTTHPLPPKKPCQILKNI